MLCFRQASVYSFTVLGPVAASMALILLQVELLHRAVIAYCGAFGGGVRGRLNESSKGTGICYFYYFAKYQTTEP